MIKIGTEIWLLSASKEWGFGCLDHDGGLLRYKLAEFFDTFQRCRNSFVRVLPYLLSDPGQNGQVKLGQSNITPFQFNGQKFDLLAYNPAWWDALRASAVMANDRGMEFVFNIVDSSHGEAPEGPWRNNIQGLDEWYEAGPVVMAYIKRVCDTLAGLKIAIEVQNEPPVDAKHPRARFIGFYRKVSAYLSSRGVRHWSGAEFFPDSGRTYKEAYGAKDKQTGGDGLNQNRLTQPSSMHHVDDARIRHLTYPGRYQVPDPKDGRLWYLCSDGGKPRRDRAMERAFWGPVFKSMPILGQMGCYIASNVHSYNQDHNQWDKLLDASGGIAEAYGLEVFPVPVVPTPVIPDPPPLPEPTKPEEIDMQYTRLFSGFKKQFPFISMRLLGWIKQNWTNKTIRYISQDASIVTAIIASLVWLAILIF